MTMACCVVITAVASSSEVAVETQHPCGTSGAPPRNPNGSDRSGRMACRRQEQPRDGCTGITSYELVQRASLGQLQGSRVAACPQWPPTRAIHVGG